MRIQLIAIGSTGDVLPLIVLGKTLIARGHDVSLGAFDTLRPLTEGTGIRFQTIPGDAKRFIGQVIQPGASPATYLARLEHALRDVAIPLLDAYYDICAEADLIVSTFFGSLPYTVAGALDIPLVQVNYFPTDRTGYYCMPVMRQLPIGHAGNRATYRIAYQLIDLLQTRYITPWCAARGITPRGISHGLDYSLNGHTVPVLYAFSEHIVPRPPEWPENLHIVGFWEDAAREHTPSPALMDFLAAGDTPVYIGFGSMTSGDMGEALSAVLQALERTGLRAVLSSGWGGLDAIATPSYAHILHGYIPHSWIFEQTRAVVHHGGAGTTAAGLIAGKPTLVVPFGGDQFFWGERVHAMDCGPRPLSRTRLTAGRLASALRELVDTLLYAQRARELGALLRQESGADRAADIIERAAREQ
ncbi:glycosyltransferase [Eubacteriales bacterium OttesenSCG-928-A19]|nr:glycosyltransferase [Eubacteriales bacterium OttesenSCG-928-A19]